MESEVPMETDEEMDIELGRVVRDCLSVSLILRKIFQHFSTNELLKLSLVNKEWSYEARTLLRDRGTVAVPLNKNKTCQDLTAVASSLLRTKEITRVLPFSGVTLSLGGMGMNHTDLCLEQSTPELDQAYEDILDQLTWKHLTVRFALEFTEEFITCPGFLLLEKILKKFGPNLEKLTLGLPRKRGDFMQELIEGCCGSFPRLQLLKIEDIASVGVGYTNLIKWLVSHAPNLKVLHTNGRVNLMGNLLEGSSAEHVSEYPLTPFMDDMPDDVGPLRMSRMLFVDVWIPVVVERFNRITIALLEASRIPLSWMHIDALFLAPLTTYGMSLENVRIFEINFDLQKLESMHPQVLRLVKFFDFTRTFPNLEAVKINCYSDYFRITDGIDEMIEQGNAAFREPTPDGAVNIKNLSMECQMSIRDATCQFLSQMFPYVESLSITATEIPFGCIWESWRDLKVLDVLDVSEPSVVKDLDSIFCGIFPEEVAVLKEQDEEYLKVVNIVPIMPSITCLKNLRNLNLIFGKALVPPVESAGDPTCVYSKVTALVAFQRCPHLSVTVVNDEARRRKALSQLRS